MPFGGYELKKYPKREARFLPRDILNIYYHKHQETNIKLSSINYHNAVSSIITIIDKMIYA